MSVSSEYVTVKANGLEFEVLQAGSGDKLALCLHGWPEAAVMWKHHLDTLVGLGYRVWAPNQRGYGNSSKPPLIADYASDRLVADVAALIDASGATSTTLIAHDWGGFVAWLMAMNAVRPLERSVIMNAPHPALFDAAIRGSGAQRLRSWYMLLFQLPWLPEKGLGRNGGERLEEVILRTAWRPESFTREELDIYKRQAADFTTMKSMLNWYRAALGGGDFLKLREAGYPPIETPVMVVWGEEDTALGMECVLGTERYVTDCRIERIAGASHWVSQDATEKVNALLESFLGRA